MRRTQLKAIVVLCFGFAGEVEAQHVQPRRIGFGVGLDAAGSITTGVSAGHYLGPTFGRELASRGPLRVRMDASLQVDVWPKEFVFPNMGDGWRGPSVQDSRALNALATTTMAAELGTGERFTSGGLFIAARVGGGVGHWGTGVVRYSLAPGPTSDYREPAFVAPVVIAGAEAGLWVPMSGRPHRIALRVDGVHRQDFSTTRVALVVLRHW
jgi:hypothetical protein